MNLVAIHSVVINHQIHLVRMNNKRSVLSQTGVWEREEKKYLTGNFQIEIFGQVKCDLPI